MTTFEQTDYPLPTEWEGKARRVIVEGVSNQDGSSVATHEGWELTESIEGYARAGQLWLDGDYESTRRAPSWKVRPA